MRRRETPPAAHGPDPGELLAVPAAYHTGILEHLPWGVVVVDGAERLRAVNARLTRLYRLAPDAVTPGAPLSDLYRAIAGSGLLDPELSHPDSGYARWVRSYRHGSGSPDRLFLTDGRVIEIFCSKAANGDAFSVHTDVSLAFANESALSEQRIQLSSVIENVSEGIALIDPRGQVAAVNRRLMALYRIDPADVRLGMPYAEFAARMGDLQSLSEARRAREIDHRVRFVTDPEQRVTLRQLFTGETFELSKAITENDAILLTVRDLTEQLRQARAQEEERRREREASETKARFLARMSHEMRTPLNGVLGLAALLGRTELDDQQAQFVAAIRDSGAVLLRLIDDLLESTRLETVDFELVHRPFRLSDVVREAASLIEPDTRMRGLWLRTEPGNIDLPALMGDAVRLKQVMMNLLANAAKFTETGGVTIGYQAVLHESSADVTLAIADTGIGIAPEDQERIFEQFTQLEDRDSRRFGGVGLGLAIVRRLVSAMGGRVEVASAPDRGSTFRVMLTLPLAPESPSVIGSDGRG
ncbi:MAG: PAS-domain containing protein [Pseudomonadota bacterium]